MRKIAIITLILVIWGGFNSACHGAPLFGDVPDTHWANDAVANLAAKGIVEGYPDGTFKGDRACTRYEMAMVIARFLAKNDQEHATFATKAELQETRRLVMEYLDELQAYGVRVTNLEEDTSKLNKRVTELERVRFYGSFEASGVSQFVGGDIPFIGTIRVPGVDWSSGRLLTSGSGMTALAKLGIDAKIAPEINAGVELASFTNLGDPNVNNYWGIVPPYLSNPYLAAGTNPSQWYTQSLLNIPWSRTTIDRLWMVHKPTETKVICGSFTPEYIDRSVLAGPKNPNIHGPDTLPFYGAKVSSYRKGRLLSYEAAFATVPQDSSGVFNYNTWMGVGNVGLNWDKARIAFNYMRTVNEMSSFGTIQGAGIIPIPLRRQWLDARTNSLRSFVGPQAQNTAGASANVDLSKEVKFVAEYAATEYNPDTSKTNFNATARGDLLRAGFSGYFQKKLALDLYYSSVSAAFDPFLLRYQVPPNIPTVLPYGNYYTDYWQLHDYLKYPSNRQGLSFTGSYKWPDTMLSANWSSLQQVRACTPANVQSIGYVEPIFSTLQGGGSELGTIGSWGIGISHTFPTKLSAFINYSNYTISRSSAFPLDTINIGENFYSGGLSYPFTNKFSVFASYTVFSLKGNYGIINSDFRQDIPSLGASYSLGQDSYIRASYRLFSLSNNAVARSNWSGNQAMMEYKITF
ncbi:MAG: S-layer homology domain-containing protein [Candidatus Eremiobacteraeota bacterium]|nr:S-layer homology domain-containing protein [Candidatus Eremiobacteraeota bacterium]